MSIDESLLTHVIAKPRVFLEVQRAGITEDYFVDDYAKVWAWIARKKLIHGKVPSARVVLSRFPDLDLKTKVKDRDVPILVADLQKRKKYIDFLDLIDNASRTADEPDDIDTVLAELQGGLNMLSLRDGRKDSIVDLFSEETQRRIRKDLKRRRQDAMLGIPTGLKRFDSITGGLQAGRMVTIIGRTGKGKSWLNLLMVASAVMHGSKVMLYPLEMSLEDTALRLYTIFSCRMFGPSKALKHLDLNNGIVSPKKVRSLMGILEDKYPGQLLVADIGAMSEAYTIERISSEVQINKPDLFWIDYITLMKAPGVGRDGQEDHTTVKALSNGIRRIAIENQCVGGASAQVNRSAIIGREFLPRLENIAYGDSIGQDSDHVLSINRKDGDSDIYYGLVKNRHGPETGKIRVRFAVNKGDIAEHEKQNDEDDDD